MSCCKLLPQEHLESYWNQTHTPLVQIGFRCLRGEFLLPYTWKGARSSISSASGIDNVYYSPMIWHGITSVCVNRCHFQSEPLDLPTRNSGAPELWRAPRLGALLKMLDASMSFIYMLP